MSSQECRDFAALFGRELDRLEGEIAQYSNESKLWAVSGNQKNSAGNLALHVCGNLMHYIAEGLGNSGYIRDRGVEFSERVTRVELIERVRACKMTVTAVLETLDDSILEDLSSESTGADGKDLFTCLPATPDLAFGLASRPDLLSQTWGWRPDSVSLDVA